MTAPPACGAGAATPSSARRLFVAVVIPPHVHRATADQVSALLAEMRRADPATLAAVASQPDHALPGHLRSGGLRWVQPESWHLTLAFLGGVEPRRLPDLETRLGRAASRAVPLELRLNGAGRFGRNVLWAGVDGDRDGVRRLAAATAAAARRVGLDVEDKPYRPHLTLARGDGRTDLRSIADALAGLASPPWTADELELVRSHLGEGPNRTARHEVVARWPLGRPPPSS